MDYALRFLIGGMVVSLFCGHRRCAAAHEFCRGHLARPFHRFGSPRPRLRKARRRLCCDRGPFDAPRSGCAGSLRFCRLSIAESADCSTLRATLAALAVWLAVAVGLKQTVPG